jgi:serpin B
MESAMRISISTIILAGSFVVIGSCARTSRQNVGPLAPGNNSFAVDLYGRLRHKPGNILFSPLSLSAALGMTYAGAAGQTADEIARVMHFNLGRERLNAAFGELLETWHDKERARNFQISIAKALWLQKGCSLHADFQNSLQNQYRAHIESVDFASDPAQARRTIDTWITKETRGKITQIVPAMNLSRDALLMVTTALYLKAPWSTGFQEAQTKTETFWVAEDQSVQTPLMHRVKEHASYGENADCQMLQLLCTSSSRLSVVFLLPRQRNGLARLEQTLSASRLQDWLGSMKDYEVDVVLPRFKVTAQYDVKDELQQMGVARAFVPDADFSGVSSARPLYLFAIAHKAFLDLNEQGIEAAAASGEVLGPNDGEQAKPAVFRADHPFMFLIRNYRDGNILFLGRLVNPKESGAA